MFQGEANLVRLRPVSTIAVAVMFTALGVLVPSTSDAAKLWPWSKRQDRGEESAPLPPPAEGVVVAQTDVAERLNQAEARIRELTGQVEQLNYRLNQIQQQLGMAVDPAPTAGVAAAPPEELGTLTIEAPAADQPIDLAAPVDSRASSGSAVGTTEIVSLGVPSADYDQAYSAILSGDYALAEVAFRNFLANYPADARVPDARYWLGESLFARGQYSDAADEFLAGYKANPEGGKAPDTLLKLGLSLAGLGEAGAACSTYAEVLRKYPDASKSLHDRVAAEQAVAGC